ncbi:MAG TPA: hypothetical protein DEB39_07940 [Planctomycetaceae bacterium]|nr:hypothetical protein [Planctomycetaceae bacterium]
MCFGFGSVFRSLRPFTQGGCFEIRLYWKRDAIGCLVKTACCNRSLQRLYRYQVARIVRATGDCLREQFQAVVSGRLRYNIRPSATDAASGNPMVFRAPDSVPE